MRKLLQYFAAASMLLLLAACVNTITRGHLKEDEAMASVKIGTTTQDEVRTALGSPSSESTFGPLTWYYVSSIKQSRSLFKPEVTDQRVVEIAFDASGVVSAIKNYSMADGKKIEIASQTTPTEGQKLGIFEQIFSNLGRFNKDADSTSNSHTHGTTVPSMPGGR